MNLDDLRLFAKVVEAGSFTAAARVLAMPKQTLSRRIAELERELDVQLLRRTTRKLHLTEVGAAYAARCAELVRLAEDAHRAVSDAREEPAGALRITADPLFGELFLAPLAIEFAQRWPRVALDLVLTQRRVDLVDEGFDIAFRIGHIDDSALIATQLGPARIRYCASPAYLAARGTPAEPGDLAHHDCVVLVADSAPMRWPFRGGRGLQLLSVCGRMRVNNFAVAHAATLGGLGIGLYPAFLCEADLAAGRLAPVLDDFVPDAGAVWLVYPARRGSAAAVRAFLDLAIARFRPAPPWVVRG